MSEAGNENAGERTSRGFLDAVKALYEPGELDKVDELENLQTMVRDFSAEELLDLEDFIAGLQKERGVGNEPEYAENICKNAIVNMKWGLNIRSAEYVKRLVAEAGLSDKVFFHRMSFSHDEREGGKEIAVGMALDCCVYHEDFLSFLQYARGVEGVRVEGGTQDRPNIVFPVENLKAEAVSPVGGGDTLDGERSDIQDMSGHMIGGF